MAQKLSVKDRRILFALESDARLSHKAIGRLVGLSADVVRYRIQRLQREGIIGGFLTFVNFAKLGLQDYGVFVSTRHLTELAQKELLSDLASHDHVSYLAKTAGRYDLIVGILARNVQHFHSLLITLMAKHESFIWTKDISIRLSLFHFPRHYLVASLPDVVRETSLPYFGGEVEQVAIDELDKNILSLIANNARMTCVEIGHVLDVPSTTIALRIKNLQRDGVIGGFLTLLHPQKYGYLCYDVLLRLKHLSSSQEQKFFSFCRQHQHIAYAIKTVGQWDYELVIEVPDQDAYQKVLSLLREEFSAWIIRMEFVHIFEDIKYSLYPFGKEMKSKTISSLL